MKIAEISTFINYSVGTIMKNLQYYFKNQGDECKVFYSRGKHINVPDVIHFGSSFGSYIAALKSRIFDNDGFNSYLSTKQLIKKLRIFNPDIIHIHCLHGYYINVKLFFNYLKKYKIKVIWTMHDAWAITGHCCYFSQVNCKKHLIGCYNCPQKKEYPASFVFDRSKRNWIRKKKIFTSLNSNQLTIVSPSKWLDCIINTSYLNKYTHVVIHNGIDITKYINKQLAREKLLLAVASVWDKRKNIDRILKLSNNLQAWSVIIVGKISKEIDKNKYPNIKFIERTEDFNALIDIYNKCSVFINPTLDDNFPTVNLEAQLCGLKVLSYDTGGSLETDCGMMTKIDSNTCIDDEFLDRINEKKNELKECQFTIENMAVQYFSLMQEIIRGE